MKKIILILLTIVLITVYCFRVAYVTANAPIPKIIKYHVGEEVAIENDFFESISENMNGYSVIVKSTEALAIDEFESKYGKIDSDYKPDYVYIIHAVFKNTFNDKTGIDLTRYMIQNGAFMNYFNQDIYMMVNDFKSPIFSLRQNTEKEFLIPFDISLNRIDINDVRKENMELVVTLYPNKKSIILN